MARISDILGRTVSKVVINSKLTKNIVGIETDGGYFEFKIFNPHYPADSSFLVTAELENLAGARITSVTGPFVDSSIDALARFTINVYWLIGTSKGDLKLSGKSKSDGFSEPQLLLIQFNTPQEDTRFEDVKDLPKEIPPVIIAPAGKIK